MLETTQGWSRMAFKGNSSCLCGAAKISRKIFQLVWFTIRQMVQETSHYFVAMENTVPIMESLILCIRTMIFTSIKPMKNFGGRCEAGEKCNQYYCLCLV